MENEWHRGLDLFSKGDFLRILPWDSSPFFTTIWDLGFFKLFPGIEHANPRRGTMSATVCSGTYRNSISFLIPVLHRFVRILFCIPTFSTSLNEVGPSLSHEMFEKIQGPTYLCQLQWLQPYVFQVLSDMVVDCIAAEGCRGGDVSNQTIRVILGEDSESSLLLMEKIRLTTWD